MHSNAFKVAIAMERYGTISYLFTTLYCEKRAFNLVVNCHTNIHTDTYALSNKYSPN